MRRTGPGQHERDRASGGARSNPAGLGVRRVAASRRGSACSAPEKIIDRVAERLRVDRRPFATCRAQLAGATISWIVATRRAGVRTTPATIVGGRIYGPINDLNTLQLLVEAELAPGMLGEAAPDWTAR